MSKALTAIGAVTDLAKENEELRAKVADFEEMAARAHRKAAFAQKEVDRLCEEINDLYRRFAPPISRHYKVSRRTDYSPIQATTIQTFDVRPASRVVTMPSEYLADARFDHIERLAKEAAKDVAERVEKDLIEAMMEARDNLRRARGTDNYSVLRVQ